MASAANLTWLRETGRRYIIGAPKSELKKYATALAAQSGWHAIRDGVEVKLTRCPDTRETLILCRSAERRNKEQAMHEKFSRRIEAALARLTARIERSTKRIDATLELWQQRAGLGNSPRTVLEELVRIQSHDVVLPTANYGDIRLRCVAQPDDAQAVLPERLGIVLPKTHAHD